MRQWPARIGTLLAVIYPVGIIIILYCAFRDVNEQDRQLTDQAKVEATKTGRAASVLTVADLNRLSGNWIGTLEYLDYKDNTSRTRLKTTLTCELAGNELQATFSYVEPSGKSVPGDPTKWMLIGDGSRIRIGTEEWALQSHSDTEWVLSRDGTDNNKPATLRRVISVRENRLQIRNEVRYSNAAESLTRNEYTLTKS